MQESWKKHLKQTPWIIPFGTILILFLAISTYSPLLAFGKPLIASFEGQWYFPLWRYLLYNEAFSKPIDLCFNIWMLASPVVLWMIYRKVSPYAWLLCAMLFVLACGYCLKVGFKDPAADSQLYKIREHISLSTPMTWERELSTLSGYARFNLIWERARLIREHEKMKRHLSSNVRTPWEIEQQRFNDQLASMHVADPYRIYLIQRWNWIQDHQKDLKWTLDPLIRPYFWEENTGKDQMLNPHLPWYERARINRKDLVAGLIYGTRVSFVVGILTVALAITIGVPLGGISGYWAGRCDMIMMRFIEIWESFPTFFMLLFITALVQSKSILLVITILGIFNWTGFARYIRGEVLRQKQMPYCEACRSQGLSSWRILFSQIMPNAISPVLTLLPFAVMGAISSEAGLSFLGLGEEESCSWGTLMDEGRMSFPAESYLLWPPAIALSLLLISIAIVGDWIHDQLNPKLKG